MILKRNQYFSLFVFYCCERFPSGIHNVFLYQHQYLFYWKLNEMINNLSLSCIAYNLYLTCVNLNVAVAVPSESIHAPWLIPKVVEL
jgi:hypothetical protein